MAVDQYYYKSLKVGEREIEQRKPNMAINNYKSLKVGKREQRKPNMAVNYYKSYKNGKGKNREIKKNGLTNKKRLVRDNGEKSKDA